MVTLEQELEQTHGRMALDQRFHLQGPQGLQPAVDQTLIMGDFADEAIARAVDRSSSSRRQTNLASGLQLQEERPAGHVFEPPDRVTPTPHRTQLAGETGSIPSRMRTEPRLDQCDIFGADSAALNEMFSLHGRKN